MRPRPVNPDVITLDIEMPKMDGLVFLEKIMTLRPMPVVMVSTLTQRGAEATLKALELGAVDYIAKPSNVSGDALAAISRQLVVKVKAAAQSNLQARAHTNTGATQVTYTPGRDAPVCIAIGASTGGVEAIREVLKPLPANCPPIVITQHMPEGFTRSFAERLNGLIQPSVSEAAQGSVLQSGHIHIAPGGRHLRIQKKGVHYSCVVEDGELVSGHKPSVDVLFQSVAETAGNRAVGVILTGMGKDGAAGLLKMRQAGAHTLGQDAATSLIYGMPRAAFESGAVERQLPLTGITAAMLQPAQPEIA